MRPPMSEISDNLHLRGTRKDAIALIERLGALGGVLPENDAWTCALLSAAPEAVAPAWPGILVHYLHSPGHETRVTLFEKGAEAGRIWMLVKNRPTRGAVTGPAMSRLELDWEFLPGPGRQGCVRRARSAACRSIRA